MSYAKPPPGRMMPKGDVINRPTTPHPSTRRLDDEELFSIIYRRGDRMASALAELCERFRPKVTTFIRNMVNSLNIDLDEISSQGNTALAKWDAQVKSGKLHRHDETVFAKYAIACLFEIARNLARVLLSQAIPERGRRGQSLDAPTTSDSTLPLGEILPCPQSPAEDETVDRLMVHDALHHLASPLEREAIVLYFWQGQTYEEIGKDQGVSITAVGKRIKKGLSHLKRFLLATTSEGKEKRYPK